MAIKGFRSALKALVSTINGTNFEGDAEGYATIQDAGSNRKALDVHPIQLGELATGTLDAVLVANQYPKRIVQVTGHSFIPGKSVIRFTSGPNIHNEYAVTQIIDANNVLIAGEMEFNPTASDAFSHLLPVTLKVDLTTGGLLTTAGPTQYRRNTVATEVNEDTTAFANDRYLPVKDFGYAVVDQLDIPLMDTSILAQNIPASGSAPLIVVASLAAKVLKLRSVDDIGNFIGVYRDAAGLNLACILPLGGGEIDCKFDLGEDIYLRNMENVVISSGKIAINFLG